MPLKYKRWLIVAYLLAMMAFSLSVLWLAAPAYRGYTTSDSGYFHHLAEEIVQADGMVTVHELSHPPQGLPVGISDQLQPLLAAMIYKGLHRIFPWLTVEDVTTHLSAIFFVLMFIPVFLIGKELAGDVAGCASVFFLATMASCPGTTSPVYWAKIGAFDRDILTALFAAWTVYGAIKVLKSTRESALKFAALAGLTYGLFPIAWLGYLYLVPVIIAALLLVLFKESLKHSTPGWGLNSIKESVKANAHIIYGIVAMMGITFFVAWSIVGQSITGVISWGAEFVGLKAPAARIPQYASEMQPASWDSLYGFYGANVLTGIVFALVAIALVRVILSKEKGEWILLPWLAALAYLAHSQVRFLRLWWPLLACLAGLGLIELARWIRKLSISSGGASSGWAHAFKSPIVLALCVILIATPFVQNAYAQAEKTGPPMEAALHEALVDAGEWLRQNLPEGTIFAVQWSYGHLLTAVSKRRSVVDGCETWSLEGKWENDPNVTIRPPDYIWRPRIGQEASLVGGRRVDVDRLFSVDSDEEFAKIVRTYRDNYGIDIRYIVFDVSTAYYAVRNAIFGGRVKARTTSWVQEEPKITFNFGENRENVVFHQWDMEVYIPVDNERTRFTGYALFSVYADGTMRFLDFGFYHSPDIREMLLIYINENNQLLGASLVEMGIPLSARIFQLGWLPPAAAEVDYLRLCFTSQNGWVKVYEIVYENLPD